MPLPKTYTELVEAVTPNSIYNVVGVVTDCLPPTTTSKGSLMFTFHLNDGSTQHGLKCRLFATRADQLPRIQGLGDVLIIKRVKFLGASGILASTGFDQELPWAVLPAPIPKDWGINGPKVFKGRLSKTDFTEEHIKYAMEIAQNVSGDSYVVQSEETKAKLAKSSTQNKRCLIKDLQLETFPTILGELVKIMPMGQITHLYISDYTENSFLFDYGGTESGQPKLQNWPGPPGKYTLWIECWNLTTNDWMAENNIKPGDIVLVSNVSIVRNKDGSAKIEGKIREDRNMQDKLRIKRLKRSDAAELLTRKEELGWANSFEPQVASDTDRKSKKRKSEDAQSKSAKRKHRRKENVQQRALEQLKTTEAIDQRPETMATQETSETITSVNEHIRCEKNDFPHRTIADIRDNTTDRHKLKLPDGQIVALNFAKITSHATVRVLDFKPKYLEQFAKAREMTQEEIDAAGENDSDGESEVDSENEDGNDSDHSLNSLKNKSTQVRRQKWEWNFALLLQDASLSTDSETDLKGNDQILARSYGMDAEYLLGLKAVDLRTNPKTLAQLRERLFILWGDLEEKKTEAAERKEARILNNVSVNTSSGSSAESSQGRQPSSMPFLCQLEEYGWQGEDRIERRFRITGTTIHQGTSPTKAPSALNDGTEKWDDCDLDSPEEVAKPQQQSTRAPRAG